MQEYASDSDTSQLILLSIPNSIFQSPSPGSSTWAILMSSHWIACYFCSELKGGGMKTIKSGNWYASTIKAILDNGLYTCQWQRKHCVFYVLQKISICIIKSLFSSRFKKSVQVPSSADACGATFTPIFSYTNRQQNRMRWEFGANISMIVLRSPLDIPFFNCRKNGWNKVL
jgi:hypothetical protein